MRPDINILVVFCALFVSCNSFYIMDIFHEIYQEVPEPARIPFLNYHISKGYYESQNLSNFAAAPIVNLHPEDIAKIESIDTPKEFSVKLYEWTVRTFNLTDVEVFQLARGEELCIPCCGCIDTGDVGSICCS